MVPYCCMTRRVTNMPPSEGCQSGLCPRHFLSPQPFCPKTINLGSQQFEDPCHMLGTCFLASLYLLLLLLFQRNCVFFIPRCFLFNPCKIIFTFGIISITQYVAQSLAPRQKAKPNKPLLPPGPRCCATASPSPSASRGSVRCHTHETSILQIPGGWLQIPVAQKPWM